MLDFKKLAEVTHIEDLPEGVSVLVNHNGEIKQVPASKIQELVPSEVTNAIETGGMGWTDEDDTVHPIDEKYIPSSSGVVIVNFEKIEDELLANKTVAEVSEAMQNSIVIGMMKVDESHSVPLGVAGFDVFATNPGFGTYRVDNDHLTFLISVENDEWVFNGL